ncbi:hypothetical protein A2335_01800 [Candidatus Peregrinibacteria bacterium RIFOXYB2_FULL_32_7]|nr:MAG: hypothetical protein A2335_01800 [Candidatus Peregrinibacteria bacterium RIFOXYB2_FULL_32_7]
MILPDFLLIPAMTAAIMFDASNMAQSCLKDTVRRKLCFLPLNELRSLGKFVFTVPNQLWLIFGV